MNRPIPAKNPRVPIKAEDGVTRRFRARCQVVDENGHPCGWTRTSQIRAAVEEEARWHRNEHWAEWSRLDLKNRETTDV